MEAQLFDNQFFVKTKFDWAHFVTHLVNTIMHSVTSDSGTDLQQRLIRLHESAAAYQRTRSKIYVKTRNIYNAYYIQRLKNSFRLEKYAEWEN